jgi:hypothetical protein
MKRELTNQELLDRYLHSTMLPPDIAAELRSNLESLAEDRTMELGRELRPDEMSAILKQHGHPALVAFRYRDQPGRGLISPALFPLYWFTLRALFKVWLVIRLLVAVVAFKGPATAGSVLLTLSRDVVLAAFFIGAGVTAIFAASEYLEFRFRFSERWKPESLPPVPLPIRQPQITQQRPTVRILTELAGLLFLALALFWPAMFWVWGRVGTFSPSATLYAMRLPWLLLASLWISQTWLNHTRFAEARWRPLLRGATNFAGFVLALILLLQGDVLVAGPIMRPAQGASLATLNSFFRIVLAIACISSGLRLVKNLRPYLRRLGQGPQAENARPKT